MIGRWSSKITEDDLDQPKGFDAFELRLGDVMRGERATLGKSLLDVQRELRIKASYIAAIENADPDAFETPGFIAGYVRSYARYLNMDPDKAFDAFCTESGFEVAHGMSAQASVIKKPSFEDRKQRAADADPFIRPAMPFTPAGESVLSRIEPGAIGSVLVLVALIGAIGYGGYTVLQEVQRVQVSPVDETPVVLSDLDPLQGALTTTETASSAFQAPAVLDSQRAEALDRLYRPQALDVPVLVARDAPISSIDPRSLGNFAALEPATIDQPPAGDGFAGDTLPSIPQVVEAVADGVRMVAAYPSWVRVTSADGSTIFEGIMDKGDVFDIPVTEEPPVLRTGESGAIYFAMAGDCFGPAGAAGSITSNLPLSQLALGDLYEAVDPTKDRSLTRMFADLQSAEVEPSILAGIPCKTGLVDE
ncbi:MAG: RodZ domain-containing protein [Pseudomonadota bacterium]